MNSYQTLARHYDRLMAHVDYDAWLRFALRALREVTPTLGSERAAPAGGRGRILDLACGTGAFSVQLARLGFDVVAIDGSVEMLAVAEEKARSLGLNVFFSCQDLTEFAVAEPADAAVCLFDSFNYLVEEGALEQAFQRVRAALKPGAPLFFDLHTESRFEAYAENAFAAAEEDIAYIWESQYDVESKLCAMRLTLFAAEREGAGDAAYVRSEEIHLQRAFEPDQTMRALDEAGFDLIARYGELRWEPPAPDEGRVFYLVRRRD